VKNSEDKPVGRLTIRKQQQEAAKIMQLRDAPHPPLLRPFPYFR
jgi:hypothetical protein